MVARPNHPLEKRENSSGSCTSRPSVNRSKISMLYNQTWQSDVLLEAWSALYPGGTHAA
jgi:hypothetical protein